MQTAVSGPRGGLAHSAVCRARAPLVSRRMGQTSYARYAHGNFTSPPANYFRNSGKSHRPNGQRQSRLQHSAAFSAANATLPLTTGPWQRLLPACKVLAVLLCMPLVLEALAQGSQQWCLLAMAGVLLPLQSKLSQQSLKRWKHIMQAAAVEIEADTEEPPSDQEEEGPNDNTILETGAELGNVQTPASVWLPYSTGQNGKVRFTLQLLRPCTSLLCSSVHLAAHHDITSPYCNPRPLIVSVFLILPTLLTHSLLTELAMCVQTDNAGLLRLIPSPDACS